MHVHVTDEAATTCVGDVLVLPVFQDGKLPEVTSEAARLTGLDLSAIAGRFRLRRAGDRCWVPARGALGCDDILLVCVGARNTGKVTANDLRTAAMRCARHVGRAHVVCSLGDVPVTDRDSAELAAEAMTIGAYRFDRYRTAPPEDLPVERVTFPGTDERSIRAGSEIGKATNLARDLTNTPPADLTPEVFAGICEDLASQAGFFFQAFGIEQLRDEGFGGIVGVGAGSPHPPVLVCLETGDESSAAAALVGKGITFDSGGLDIKQLPWMVQMKDDMAGAAAIVAAMSAFRSLCLTPHVRAYLAIAENAVSGNATRPGDVLRHRNGRTTEVITPDAEGRLVLADAIAYAREKSPARIIDVATLTGSTGLGPELWGIMGNSQPLIDSLLLAGERSGEPGWQIPLWEGYRKNLRSNIADLQNFQQNVTWNHSAMWGGLYLSEFAGDCPWAHLDIGATVFRDEPDEADETWALGGTGSGTRTLIEFFRHADKKDG